MGARPREVDWRRGIARRQSSARLSANHQTDLSAGEVRIADIITVDCAEVANFATHTETVAEVREDAAANLEAEIVVRDRRHTVTKQSDSSHGIGPDRLTAAANRWTGRHATHDI